MREDIKERIESIKKGKVPVGYKKTEIGIIPKEWEVARFDECAVILGGLVDPRELPYNNMKHIGPENIEKETGRIVDVRTAKEQGLISGKYVFDSDSIVYSKVRPKLNKVCIPDFCGICSADCYVVHTKDYMEKKYLYIYILSDLFLKQIVSCSMRTKMPKVNQEELNAINIIVPPIEEQGKILRIIENYDKSISNMEKRIVCKYKQKQWIIQWLITGKKRLPDFYGVWKKTKLADVLSERKEFSKKEMLYEHVTLSKEGIIPKSSRYDREHLVKNIDKNYKITYIDDICYNPANLKFGVICRNTYGTAIFSPIYVTFEVNKEYDVDFISQYVTRWSFIKAVRKYEEGTVYERMAVKSDDFLRLEILLPELDEQKAIAKILVTADKEIELLEKKLELIKQERKAMMRLLLTGIVRVND